MNVQTEIFQTLHRISGILKHIPIQKSFESSARPNETAKIGALGEFEGFLKRDEPSRVLSAPVRSRIARKVLGENNSEEEEKHSERCFGNRFLIL